MSSTPDHNNFEQLLNYRRQQVRQRKFRPLGTLEKVMFEKSTVANLDGNPLAAGQQAVALDWYKLGPLVGLSENGAELLVCSRMRHPPALPDPHWTPPQPYYDAGGNFVPQAQPKIEQRLRDRACGTFQEFLVFGPVHQICLLLVGGWGLIECSTDAAGRHTMLLFDPAQEEGHFVFGHQDLTPLFQEPERDKDKLSQVWPSGAWEGG